MIGSMIDKLTKRGGITKKRVSASLWEVRLKDFLGWKDSGSLYTSSSPNPYFPKWVGKPCNLKSPMCLAST